MCWPMALRPQLRRARDIDVGLGHNEHVVGLAPASVARQAGSWTGEVVAADSGWPASELGGRGLVGLGSGSSGTDGG